MAVSADFRVALIGTQLGAIGSAQWKVHGRERSSVGATRLGSRRNKEIPKDGLAARTIPSPVSPPYKSRCPNGQRLLFLLSVPEIFRHACSETLPPQDLARGDWMNTVVRSFDDVPRRKIAPLPQAG